MQSSTARLYLWLFGVLAAVGLVTDQVSKYVVFAVLYPPEPPCVIWPGLFELRVNYTDVLDPGDQPLSYLRTISGMRLPHVNRGALFGVGNADTDHGGFNNVFMGISIAAALFILIWAQRPTVARDRMLTGALGLILGGTLGNLYDRVVFGGVRDFLHCYWYDHAHAWPDFNIADCCLVCGASLLLIHSFFFHDEKPQQPAQPTAVTGEVTVNTIQGEATLPASTHQA